MSGLPESPAPTLEHFVLTNFNVRLGWSRDVHGVPVLTEAWMEQRWELFETFCLPSIRAQTSQRFRWLIRFDPSTPSHHRDRFRRLTADLPNVVPLWRAESFRAAICRCLDYSTDVVLTTRLDNDDALRREALAWVQAAVGTAYPEFINFTNGCRLVRADGRLVRASHPSNPFLSLAERMPATGVARRVWRVLPMRVLDVLVRADPSPRLQAVAGPLRPVVRRLLRLLLGPPLLTARCINHNHARKVAAVRQVSGEPAWLQVVHERNAQLRAGSGRPCPSRDLEVMFGLRWPGRADQGR
jgi:hypothetical protein